MRTPRDITLDSEMPSLPLDVSGFFSATTISFVVADATRPDHPIVYVNRAFELTTGYSHRFVVGKNCRFLQGPETDPIAIKNIAVALKRGEAVKQRLLNYRADGSEFINDLVITPIADAAGEPIYFVGVQRELEPDTTNPDDPFLLKTVDIVRQQVQLHLTVVMEMSRLHIEGTPEMDDSDGSRDLISLLRRLEILDLLYNNLNETTMRSEQLDVGTYVSQIAAKLVATQPLPGIRINIATEVARVPIDVAVRMGVVLAELLDQSLSNSFNGMDEGQIEVRLSKTATHIELTVFDDGQGDPSAEDWLASGALTPKVIYRLIEPMNAELLTPHSDEGREITLRVPLDV